MARSLWIVAALVVSSSIARGEEVVAQPSQPVVINDRLMNLPAEGLYNWDPGAYFGMYHLDSLWFAPNTAGN